MSRRLVLVVHRYGPDVGGGAEKLARDVARRLATPDAAGEADRVEVWTSCARDYLTWKNELPAGTSRDGPVVVRRFPVDRPRRIRPFGRLTRRLVAGPHSLEHELEWMERQGPRTLGLVEALRDERDRHDAFLFFTYLYYPTFHGLPVVGSRALLVPTAHDEPPLHFDLFQSMFGEPGGFVFQTPEERDLVDGLFGVGERPAAVAGVGLEVPPDPGHDGASVRARWGVPDGPLVVCVGRVDRVKGSPQLARAFLEHRSRGGAGTLLFLGREHGPMPEDPTGARAVRYLGYVPEADKWAALRAADLAVVPSPYESLSLATLEAAAVGTPVLAHGGSPVLVGQCERLGCGRTFRDWDEAPAVLGSMLADPGALGRWGEAGRRAVAALGGWDGVIATYRRLVDEVRAA